MPVSKIHNVGFYKIASRAISCMSYNSKQQKIAVCRSDSNIEIWNIANAPFIEKTIADNINISIESVIWCRDRLFSVKIDGTLTEYDLFSLCSKYSVPVTSGAAWCIDINKSKTYLAVGTDIGYINIFEIVDDGVNFERLLDKQEGRILSLKYDVTEQYIVTGSIDTIRIWNVSTGHAIHKMVTGRAQNKQETIVWSLAITNDFTIISGDSRGKITFWDGNNGTYIESYLSHRADILSICLSDDQKTLYCAGIDPLIMSFEQVQLKSNHFKWVKSIQRKIHDHDVKSLILAGNRLFSAGVDGYLAMSSYPPKVLVKYPPLLQNPILSMSPKHKLILLRYPTYVELWKLATPETSQEVLETNSKNVDNYRGILPLKEKPENLLQLKAKDEFITCSALSGDSLWLIFSTRTKLRIYKLSLENSPIELTRIDDISSECQPAFKCLFTKCNSKIILATFNGQIQIVELVPALNKADLIQTISLADVLIDTVHILTLSPCGKYLIAADTRGYIAIWNEETRNKKGKTHWNPYCQLPRYKCPITSLSVNYKCLLVAVYADHKIVEYDIKGLQFTEFSNTLSIRDTKKWINRYLPISGIAHDPRANNIIILHDDSALYILDKNKKLPEYNSKIPRIESPIGDTSASRINETCGFQVIMKYKHLVHFGHLRDDELIAVEVNPLRLIQELPPCLKVKQFGAM